MSALVAQAEPETVAGNIRIESYHWHPVHPCGKPVEARQMWDRNEADARAFHQSRQIPDRPGFFLAEDRAHFSGSIFNFVSAGDRCSPAQEDVRSLGSRVDQLSEDFSGQAEKLLGFFFAAEDVDERAR